MDAAPAADPTPTAAGAPGHAAGAGTSPDPDGGRDGLVWHYTDGPGLLSILEHRVLWATASGYLNDAEEVELGNRLLLERFEALADSRHPVFGELRDRLGRSDVKRGPSPSWYFILSASTTPDSLAMWRSYGGRGESYAIGLDRSAPLRVLVDDPATAEGLVVRQHGWTPVRYDREGQELLVDAVFRELEEDLGPLRALHAQGRATTADYLAVLDDTLDAAEQALVLIKHPGFLEERETRHSTVVLGEGPRTQVPAGIARFRHTSYGMTPYVRLTGDGADAVGHLTTRPAPLPIREVAISPSPNGPAAAESVAALLASHRMPDVPVVRSAIPFRG